MGVECGEYVAFAEAVLRSPEGVLFAPGAGGGGECGAEAAGEKFV